MRQRRYTIWTNGIGTLELPEFLRLGPLPLSGCQLADLISSPGGLVWTCPGSSKLEVLDHQSDLDITGSDIAN
jgi:hypothetical protein